MFADGLKEIGERLHIRARAFVQHMRQRQLRYLIDNQTQTHLAKIVPTLFIMPPLWQFRPKIRAGDMGVEVGCVIGQSPKLQLLDTNHFPHQGAFDLRQFVQWYSIHLIPEVLAGEIGSGEFHQLRQIGSAGPIGKRPLTARSAGPRDHGGYKRLAHSQSCTDLYFAVRGERAIDMPGNVQLAGQTEQSSNGTCGYRRDLDRDLVELPVTVENIIDTTEMSEHANGGFAFVAEGLDDPVVPDAMRGVGL